MMNENFLGIYGQMIDDQELMEREDDEHSKEKMDVAKNWKISID